MFMWLAFSLSGLFSSSARLTLIPSVSVVTQGSIKTSGKLSPQNLNDHSFKPEKSIDFGFPLGVSSLQNVAFTTRLP